MVRPLPGALFKRRFIQADLGRGPSPHRLSSAALPRLTAGLGRSLAPVVGERRSIRRQLSNPAAFAATMQSTANPASIAMVWPGIMANSRPAAESTSTWLRYVE